MPLQLVPPRDGKSPNWSIRGTYLGTSIDRTAGTPSRKLAARVLAKLKVDIEIGRLAPVGAPTFASAALSYVKTGGSKRFLPPLAEHFGTTLLTRIDQAAIDDAAASLYPESSPRDLQSASLHASFRDPETCQSRHRHQAPQGSTGNAQNGMARPIPGVRPHGC